MAKHIVTTADLIEDENGDCKYVGPLEPAQNFLRESYAVTVLREEASDRVSVLVSTTDVITETVTWETCDSWGTGPDEETAWRYVVGAEFGPADSEFTPFELG